MAGQTQFRRGSGYRLGYKSVEVQGAGTTTPAIDLEGGILTGITFDSGLDSIAATFQTAAEPDGTFTALYDQDGNPVSWTIAASRCVVDLEGALALAAPRWLKVVLGTAETGDTTLILHIRYEA